MTDDGLKALARPDGGLKGLVELNLWWTPVTDVGLAELARPDSGLKALTRLYLQKRKVTDAAVEALKMARPTLQVHR